MNNLSELLSLDGEVALVTGARILRRSGLKVLPVGTSLHGWQGLASRKILPMQVYF